MNSLLVDEIVRDIRFCWPRGPWDLVALTSDGAVADRRIYGPETERRARRWIVRHLRLDHSLLCALPKGDSHGN